MRALTIALCLLATPALAGMTGTTSVTDGDYYVCFAPDSRHLEGPIREISGPMCRLGQTCR